MPSRLSQAVEYLEAVSTHEFSASAGCMAFEVLKQFHQQLFIIRINGCLDLLKCRVICVTSAYHEMIRIKAAASSNWPFAKLHQSQLLVFPPQAAFADLPGHFFAAHTFAEEKIGLGQDLLHGFDGLRFPLTKRIQLALAPGHLNGQLPCCWPFRWFNMGPHIKTEILTSTSSRSCFTASASKTALSPAWSLPVPKSSHSRLRVLSPIRGTGPATIFLNCFNI